MPNEHGMFNRLVHEGGIEGESTPVSLLTT
jgi:hypothetical protein